MRAARGKVRRRARKNAERWDSKILSYGHCILMWVIIYDAVNPFHPGCTGSPEDFLGVNIVARSREYSALPPGVPPAVPPAVPAVLRTRARALRRVRAAARTSCTHKQSKHHCSMRAAC